MLDQASQEQASGSSFLIGGVGKSIKTALPFILFFTLISATRAHFAPAEDASLAAYKELPEVGPAFQNEKHRSGSGDGPGLVCITVQSGDD